jgi:hypothetical protein
MTPVRWIFSELSHYLNPAALWEPVNNKPSQGKLRGLAVVEGGTVLLHPYHITCLEALRPFYQIEFHRLAFVQCAITVLLDSGEMNENVLPGRALDEPISLGPVEPLYCALLSHKELLSTLLDDLTFVSSVKCMLLYQPPSKETKAQPDCGH